MREKKYRILVLTALFAALICAITVLLPVSTPFGYFNLGDSVILLEVIFLGPLWGSVAGGLGGAMADLFLGYPYYIPATLIVKGLLAPVAWFFLQRLKKRPFIARLAAALAGEMTMMAGYFLYDTLLYGLDGAVTALVTVNLPQGLVCAAAAVCLLTLLKKYQYGGIFNDR